MWKGRAVFHRVLCVPSKKGYYYSLLVECTHLVISVFLLTPSQISHCNPQVCSDVKEMLLYNVYFNVVLMTKDEKWVV